MYEVSTSLLNAQKGKEADIIIELERARTDYFHIDVMDGSFVKNNTYREMMALSAYVKRISNIPLDIHFMVEDINSAIEDFSVFQPNIMTFHYEACKKEEEIFKIIEFVKDSHSRVGIAIKPDTSIEKILKFLPYVHTCLVMTVEPGEGGQDFIEDMVNKIQKLNNYIQKNKLETQIEVDGGINLATHKRVKNAGASILVSGVAILRAKNYKDIIDELKKI